jgi:hypothetical protein
LPSPRLYFEPLKPENISKAERVVENLWEKRTAQWIKIYYLIFQGCVWRREAAENHLDRLSASTYSARTVAASTYLTIGKIRDRR